MTETLFTLTIYTVLIPILFCGGFYYGFATAKSVFTDCTVEKHNIPFSGLWSKGESENATFAETSGQRMARILAENVENYGTDVPQKEVE